MVDRLLRIRGERRCFVLSTGSRPSSGWWVGGGRRGAGTICATGVALRGITPDVTTAHPGRHQIRRRGRAERGRDSGTSATLVSLYHGAALVEVAEDDPPGSALDNLMTVPSEELDLRWSHRTGWVDDGSLMEASFATIGRSTIYSFTVNFPFTGEIGI